MKYRVSHMKRVTTIVAAKNEEEAIAKVQKRFGFLGVGVSIKPYTKPSAISSA